MYKPSVGIDSQADSAYVIEFNRLMRSENPPMTRRQMERKLASQEMWTEEDERELLEKQQAVAALRLKLEEERAKARTSKKKLEGMVIDVAQAQQAYLELHGTKQSYFANTLEGLADERRWLMKLVLCTTKMVKETVEEPLWNTIDELLNEKDPLVVRRVMLESTLFWQNVDTSIFDDLPGWDNLVNLG